MYMHEFTTKNQFVPTKRLISNVIATYTHLQQYMLLYVYIHDGEIMMRIWNNN